MQSSVIRNVTPTPRDSIDSPPYIYYRANVAWQPIIDGALSEYLSEYAWTDAQNENSAGPQGISKFLSGIDESEIDMACCTPDDLALLLAKAATGLAGDCGDTIQIGDDGSIIVNPPDAAGTSPALASAAGGAFRVLREMGQIGDIVLSAYDVAIPQSQYESEMSARLNAIYGNDAAAPFDAFVTTYANYAYTTTVADIDNILRAEEVAYASAIACDGFASGMFNASYELLDDEGEGDEGEILRQLINAVGSGLAAIWQAQGASVERDEYKRFECYRYPPQTITVDAGAAAPIAAPVEYFFETPRKRLWRIETTGIYTDFATGDTYDALYRFNALSEEYIYEPMSIQLKGTSALDTASLLPAVGTRPAPNAQGVYSWTVQSLTYSDPVVRAGLQGAVGQVDDTGSVSVTFSDLGYD